MHVCSVDQSCITLWNPSLQPSRLLCLWNHPGKNIGMDCHFLLQGTFLEIPGIEPTFPALAGRFFTSEPPRKPSHHDATHLKLTQYYMSIISQSLGERNSGIILNWIKIVIQHNICGMQLKQCIEENDNTKYISKEKSKQ